MNSRKKLNQKRARRARRSGARIFGTPERPRLAVHRTNRFIYAELIDDTKGRTLASASPKSPGTKAVAGKKSTKTEQAFAVGEEIGKIAVSLGIKKAVFDRREYRFHGRVKSLAEGAKKAGLLI
jgi:large subunit ribosomal protein L18